MSITGYFLKVIERWKTIKHTPTVVRDMKEIIFQYQTSRAFNEIDEDKIKYLDREFKDIEWEILK